MPNPQNAQRIRTTVLRIASQVQRSAAEGVGAAVIFLASRLRETVSEPAPRKRAVDHLGNIYYRAKTRATAGAPPRKLSGRLRQTITYEITMALGTKRAIKGVVGVKARSNKGANYPKILEQGNHKFFAPTITRYRQDLKIIVGRSIRVRGL